MRIYIIGRLIDVIMSVALNSGIYEQVTRLLRIRLAEHSASLDLISYENASVLNLLERARQCINNENLSSLTHLLINSISGIISVIGVTLVLTSFNIWLVPIAVLSGLPLLVVRLVRGKEFYRLRTKQIPAIRKRDYLWGLFNDRRSIKEMRTSGFGNYL